MPSPALDGQDFSHDDDFANEMGTWPAFSPPFGGAGVGHAKPNGSVGGAAYAFSQTGNRQWLLLEDHQQQATSASQFEGWEYQSQDDRNLINGVTPEYKHVDNVSLSSNHQQFWSADSSFHNNDINDNLHYNPGVSHFNGSMVGAVQDCFNFDPTLSLLNNNAALSTGFYNLTPQMDQPNQLNFPPSAGQAPQQTPTDAIMCTQPPCSVTFKRDADRIRHERAVHKVNQQILHLCAVPGCPKGQGAGYSRADKLTEHMWKKHGNLGFVKRT
ncbi:hypothetical protein NA56DRAFT_725824 [Hyaloscypha hepaticicola]|uniref:C2H2-type domain-containing protein n=1 Tax=Hyaloscypha hepaticicola TaxID=2082293 RepID=A0A2J6QL71_9HELO|nr:hypothetical protein NA56DRAFT_725824 [Hyaloscypha hepaticicola]